MNSLLLRLASVLAMLPASSGVVTVPAPTDEPLSPDYQVVAGGQSVGVYTARTLDPPFAGKEWDLGGPYAFANFTTDGPVEVRITFRRSLLDTVNWFHESVSKKDSSRGAPESASKQLAFVDDARKPAAVRIAIGSTLARAGTYTVPVGVLDPAEVGAETGLVKYELPGPSEDRSHSGADNRRRQTQPRLLLVQVLSDGRLKAECCPGKTPAEVPDFSRSALIYER